MRNYLPTTRQDTLSYISNLQKKRPW